MAKSLVQRPYFEVPTETKINHQLINNKKKWNPAYLILTYILLTSTIRQVRRNSKENLSSEIGTSRINVTVVNCSAIPIHTVLCKWRCNSSCSFLATNSQRDVLADKAQAFTVKVSTFYPYDYILAHRFSVLPWCCPENLKMYTCTVLLFLAACIVPDWGNILLRRFRADILLMSLL